MRCVIVPNDQMETPHYSVLRVRKGEETPTLSYMLPKLHEEAMALPSEEEYAERKRPEQPALATFAMPEVPPAPTPAEPAVKAATAAPKAVATAPAQPGLLTRFFGALKNMFSGSEVAKPVEQPAPKAEENRSVSRIVVSLARIIAATVTIAVTTVIIATTALKAVKTVMTTVVTVVRRSSRTQKRVTTASSLTTLPIRRSPVTSSRRRVVNATVVATMKTSGTARSQGAESG